MASIHNRRMIQLPKRASGAGSPAPGVAGPGLWANDLGL